MKKEILELYKEISPISAFVQGIDQCKNKIFVPSKKNIKTLKKKTESLLKKTKNKKENIILKEIKNDLKNSKQYPFVDLSSALFFYKVKKTPVKKLIKKYKKGLKILIKEYQDKELSLVDKILAKRAIKDSIACMEETDNIDKEILDLLKEYEKKLNLDLKLTQENILKKVKAKDFERKKIYPKILKRRYNIKDTPKKIEEKCLNWIKDVLPEYKKTIKKIKQEYNLKDIVEIDNFLFERTGDTLKTIKRYRKKINNLTKKHLINIPDKHNVNVKETPSYLQSMLPIAAANCTDYLKKDFKNILFITKEAKINKYFLIEIIIHEEMGHNLNFTCSHNAEIIDKIQFDHSIVVAEMIATYMEKQFYDLSQTQKISHEKNFNLFYSYIFLKRMLTIYLRAISDVRFNMEKQSPKEFLDWAYQLTKMNKSELFNQIFYRQAVPGYLVSYPLGLHKIENLKQQSSLSQKEFNSKVWSIGFPHMEIFEQKLKD